MGWKIAEAKQRFSEVVRRAARAPQPIYRRDRLVAVLLDAEDYEDFAAWKKQQRDPSMTDAIEDIRRICNEEDYELDLPERRDRPNPFAEALDEPSV